MKYFLLLAACCLTLTSTAQPSNNEYFLSQYAPYNESIPTPEEFLGYPIGSRHTRHDMIVAYLSRLAELSDRASIEQYGKTFELRPLTILTVTSPENLQKIEDIRSEHLKFINPQTSGQSDELPILIQLGYNVHGNEASSSEAALLTAYTLAASENPVILKYLGESVIFIDPTINPDGRDRHTQWVNQFRADPVIADENDAVHNEGWPRGRTNHYWFDLNRDWLLAVNPESRGKLDWYHSWYPNVVTDFHEMGSSSNYFFEPMKPIGSKDPIMPRENYEDLNELFAGYFSGALDSIGSFYYTKESFDGTYPGYGSSYPDLQGGLALLFEQAGSFGQVIENNFGELTFGFTIRNQYVSSMTTIRAAVENRGRLQNYQREFYRTAIDGQRGGYRFGDESDPNRTAAFVEFLLRHRIEVYRDGGRFVTPMAQPQRRLVQTMFETYREYRDSVFYDASAWSVANFYNIPYEFATSVGTADRINSAASLVKTDPLEKTDYAYLIDYKDYNATALLHYLQSHGLKLASAFKPFEASTNKGNLSFDYGTLLLPVSRQDVGSDEVFRILSDGQSKFQVPVYSASSGYNVAGIDLGSNNMRRLETPKLLMLIGQSGSSYVNSYEAGEVWHLLDQRLHMPVTKLPVDDLNYVDLHEYTTLILVSGRYGLDSAQRAKISSWVSGGNTLITIGSATAWAVNQKLVSESLVEAPKDTTKAAAKRLAYVTAPENSGKEEIGGVILRASLDLTHPLAFGYSRAEVPVYKNNNVFLSPGKNPYSIVSKYTENPHIDGFISNKNYEEMIKPSASVIVSALGGGRVILFADNPNFRGAWYGTNRLFLNALFLGHLIRVPN